MGLGIVAWGQEPPRGSLEAPAVTVAMKQCCRGSLGSLACSSLQSSHEFRKGWLCLRGLTPGTSTKLPMFPPWQSGGTSSGSGKQQAKSMGLPSVSPSFSSGSYYTCWLASLRAYLGQGWAQSLKCIIHLNKYSLVIYHTVNYELSMFLMNLKFNIGDGQ